MHPYLIGQMAQLRQGELLRDAEQARRARSARLHVTGADGEIRHHVRTAIGNRLVATGWRLVEAGLPHAQAVAPAVRSGPCPEAPC